MAVDNKNLGYDRMRDAGWGSWGLVSMGADIGADGLLT